jgi:hypothetical protein
MINVGRVRWSAYWDFRKGARQVKLKGAVAATAENRGRWRQIAAKKKV